MAELKDSGARREFASGAVRDIQEGKGRCDLSPLDVIGDYISASSFEEDKEKNETVNEILTQIDQYIRTGDSPRRIYSAITLFCHLRDWSTTEMLLEVSKHYEDGARKYAERNWEKGIDCHAYVDSGVRHLLKWLDDWDDEPHDRAFIWNMLGLLWTVKHKPECNDLPYNDEKYNSTVTLHLDTKTNKIKEIKDDLVLVEVHNGNKIYRNAKTGEYVDSKANEAEDAEWGSVEERLDLLE